MSKQRLCIAQCGKKTTSQTGICRSCKKDKESKETRIDVVQEPPDIAHDVTEEKKISANHVEVTDDMTYGMENKEIDHESDKHLYLKVITTDWMENKFIKNITRYIIAMTCVDDIMAAMIHMLQDHVVCTDISRGKYAYILNIPNVFVGRVVDNCCKQLFNVVAQLHGDHLWDVCEQWCKKVIAENYAECAVEMSYFMQLFNPRQYLQDVYRLPTIFKKLHNCMKTILDTPDSLNTRIKTLSLKKEVEQTCLVQELMPSLTEPDFVDIATLVCPDHVTNDVKEPKQCMLTINLPKQFHQSKPWIASRNSLHGVCKAINDAVYAFMTQKQCKRGFVKTMLVCGEQTSGRYHAHISIFFNASHTSARYQALKTYIQEMLWTYFNISEKDTPKSAATFNTAFNIVTFAIKYPDAYIGYIFKDKVTTTDDILQAKQVYIWNAANESFGSFGDVTIEPSLSRIADCANSFKKHLTSLKEHTKKVQPVLSVKEVIIRHNYYYEPQTQTVYQLFKGVNQFNKEPNTHKNIKEQAMDINAFYIHLIRNHNCVINDDNVKEYFRDEFTNVLTRTQKIYFLRNWIEFNNAYYNVETRKVFYRHDLPDDFELVDCTFAKAHCPTMIGFDSNMHIDRTLRNWLHKSSIADVCHNIMKTDVADKYLLQCTDDNHVEFVAKAIEGISNDVNNPFKSQVLHTKSYPQTPGKMIAITRNEVTASGVQRVTIPETNDEERDVVSKYAFTAKYNHIVCDADVAIYNLQTEIVGKHTVQDIINCVNRLPVEMKQLIVRQLNMNR